MQPATLNQTFSTPAAVAVTVDAAGFHAFALSLTRRCSATDLGVVVLALQDGHLAVDTLWGGVRLACTSAPRSLTARVHGHDFLRLMEWAQDAPLTGHVAMTFRPAHGEIAIADATAPAAFDQSLFSVSP